MADPVLTDVSAFRFKDMDLSGSLVSWNDVLRLRLAVHQYLKRDGAEVEPMGAEPGRFTMRLCFLGADWAKRYRAFVASIRKDPRGQLVHPILGTFRVACEGVSDAAVVPASERDSINLTTTFVEDAVDTTIAAESLPGPAARQGAIADRAAKLLQLVGIVGAFAPLVSAAATLAGAASSFAAAAVHAASTDTPDPSLDRRLDDVATAARAAADAALANTTVASDASRYQVLTAIEQLRAECLALADAVAASKPALVVYVVPGTTDVATLAAMLYGKDARGRIDELLTLNRIADPHAIPAGTVLRVAAPTL